MRTTKYTNHTNETGTWGGLPSGRVSLTMKPLGARYSRISPPFLFLCVSCISWFLLCPGQVFGSPSSALREYNAGKYDQALKEYERLLQKNADDPRLHFNAGTAAYRNQKFEEASKQFNATLASPDLKLQGLAYYNEGNALYHLGEGNPDSKKRTETWEKALQDYQSTMKLNPQDADAKFNYEFVKKRLEELKQQQQQSQQNKQDQQQNQDQQKQDQNQNQQKQDSSQQQKADQQKKQEEQQQAANKSQEQKKDQQQAQQSAGQPKENPDQKEQEAASAQALAQMTPEQAQQLLDAQKADEQMLPVRPTGKPVDRSRPIRDW